MKKFIVLALLWLPAAAFCQQFNQADPVVAPGFDAAGEGSASEPVQRPDPQGIMSDLSASLRLSSKQEERISSAIKKKTEEFDKYLKEYETTTAEEKKWRYKANEARYEMMKINKGMAETVREFLDDEQREAFDAITTAKRKPAEESAAVPAPKPAVKRRLIRRKKPRAAVVPNEEGGGRVMVDKEGASKPALRKKRVLRKKAPPAPAPAAEEPEAPAPGEDIRDDMGAGSYP